MDREFRSCKVPMVVRVKYNALPHKLAAAASSYF